MSNERTQEKEIPPSAGLRECLRADARLLLRGQQGGGLSRFFNVALNRGMQAIFLYRVSHSLWRRGVPALPMILTRIAQHLFAVDIAYQAKIGPGFVMVHCFGIVVGSAVRIEGDCCLFHGVTLGDRGSEWVGSSRPDGHPEVGKGCMFGAGAKVLGPIRIGRNSVVGANSVVLSDVPPNSVVAGLPAKVISQRPEMDENLRPIDGHRNDYIPPAMAQSAQ